MKYLSLIIAGILFMLNLSGQPTKKVLDKTTNLPVSYVTIKILNSTKGTICSGEGQFVLQINSEDSVFLSCAGYENTILIGKEVGSIVYLNQKVIELKPVVIGNKKPYRRVVIGNDKKIEKGDLAFGLFPGEISSPFYIGEYAQKIIVPDSIRLLKIKNIFVPVKRLGKCFGPLLLRVYLPDTIKDQPGTAILNRFITTNVDLLIEKKFLSVDVSSSSLFFNGVDSFFISITWPPEAFSDGCGTGLPLSKKSDAQTLYRSPAVNSFSWFPFGKMKDSKGTEFEVKTFFSIEAEIFK